MPGTEPAGSKGLVIVARGIEHHLDDTLHVTVRRFQGAGIHAQAPGDRRPDLFGVQLLSFDLAAQSLQDGLLAKGKTEGLHMADQPSLPVADGRQRLHEAFAVPFAADMRTGARSGALSTP